MKVLLSPVIQISIAAFFIVVALLSVSNGALQVLRVVHDQLGQNALDVAAEVPAAELEPAFVHELVLTMHACFSLAQCAALVVVTTYYFSHFFFLHQERR